MNNGVIASGLVSKKKIDIPDGMMIFTVALEMNRYVTCAVPLGQDVKIKEEVLMWCGIECGQVSFEYRLKWIITLLLGLNYCEKFVPRIHRYSTKAPQLGS